MFGKRKYSFNEAFAPYANNILPGDQPDYNPGMPIPPLESQNKPGFWNGGEHFGGRDAIAGILAAIGDAFARQSGGEGWAAPSLMKGRLSAIQMAKKQQEKQAEIEAMRQRYVAAGVDPSRADLAANGGESGWLPKEQELPERARMAEWYRTATPEQRAAFDASNPIITNGYGSTVVPRSSLPGGMGGASDIDATPGSEDGWDYTPGPGGRANPQNWRQGGGVGNGTGGFPYWR